MAGPRAAADSDVSLSALRESDDNIINCYNFDNNIDYISSSINIDNNFNNCYIDN